VLTATRREFPKWTRHQSHQEWPSKIFLTSRLTPDPKYTINSF
jgi:hypothetical protein